MQLPLLRVGDLDDRHAEAAEHFEIDAGVVLHVRDAAEQEDHRFDAALRQGARHHEAVAAVVAAPTEHRDAAGRERVEGGLHRGNGLAAGVLHEHD